MPEQKRQKPEDSPQLYVSCVVNMQLVLICVYRWGCTHEMDGIQSYISSATMNHDGLQIQEAGLFVDMERPYLGASPDGIVSFPDPPPKRKGGLQNVSVHYYCYRRCVF